MRDGWGGRVDVGSTSIRLKEEEGEETACKNIRSRSTREGAENSFWKLQIDQKRIDIVEIPCVRQSVQTSTGYSSLGGGAAFYDDPGFMFPQKTL